MSLLATEQGDPFFERPEPARPCPARLRAAGLACGEIGWLLGLPESEVRALVEAAGVGPEWLRKQEERKE